MKRNKSGRRNVRKAVVDTNDGNLNEEERQGCATIKEIREGILGFMPSISRHMGFPVGQADAGQS